MNLHGLVSGAIGTVNPFVIVTVQFSAGASAAPDGTLIPAYAPEDVSAQIQAMGWRDLEKMEGLNLQGSLCKIYFYGFVEAIVRNTQKGGDLVTVTGGPYAGTWLTNTVLEAWPDWCAVACILQNT